MGKVIVMSSAASPLPSEHSFGASSGPISAGEIRTLYLLMDVQKRLGGAETSIADLQDASKRHDEWIHRLTEQTAVLPGLAATIALHTKDLNGLGKVAHTAESFGKLALAITASGVVIAIAVLTYLSHHLVFK